MVACATGLDQNPGGADSQLSDGQRLIFFQRDDAELADNAWWPGFSLDTAVDLGNMVHFDALKFECTLEKPEEVGIGDRGQPNLINRELPLSRAEEDVGVECACHAATSDASAFRSVWICLLYTSDAADDLTRVDLGGRRIIK